MKSKIDQVYEILEERGLQLMSGTHLEDDGGRNILILCNDDAESSDEYFMYETYSAEDMLDYLRRENLTELV